MEETKGIEKPLGIFTGDFRLTMQLMGFWQDSRPGGVGCARADLFLGYLSMANLTQGLLADCCFMGKAPDGDWNVSHIGTKIGRCSGITDRKTVNVHDIPATSLLGVAVSDLDKAYVCQVPILNEGDTQDENGRRALFRSILLPLADANGMIIKIAVGARCRICIHDA